MGDNEKKDETCQRCDGSGTIQTYMKNHKLRTFTCPACGGSGKK